MSRITLLLRPRMVALHLLAVVLVVVMANLSMWQFNRLNERRDFNAEVRGRASLQPVPLADLLMTSPEDGEWRPVVAKGTFRAQDEVIVLNRSQDNTAGVDALTPFDFTVDEKSYAVLVDRGFVPMTADIPPPPSGEVEFLGRVRKSQERRLGGLTDPATGVLREVQRVNVERLAGQVAISAEQTVLPFYVDFLESPAVTGNLPARVANPDLSEGPHLSYAIQWIIFAICAVVAWFILVRRALRSRPSA
jgi:cytochrome oxidase assembly protein ShyY1